METTGDIGKIVFVLIEVGLLIRHPEDRLEDFEDLYDFTEAFDHAYPWEGVSRGAGVMRGAPGTAEGA